MKKIYFILILAGIALAQTSASVEREWSDLNRGYHQLKEAYDRERAQLDTLLARIDTQKENPNRDEASLKVLMAEGLQKSALVEKTYGELARMEKRLLRLRKILYRYYSARIDSLSGVLLKTEPQNRSAMEKKLALLRSRRLYVSPWIPEISFNLKLIHGISLKNADSTERKIYRAYLEGALRDVDSSLTVIRQKREELTGLVKLEQKSKTFLADIEDVYAFDDVYAGGASPETAGKTEAANTYTGNVDRNGTPEEPSPFIFSLSRLNRILLKVDGRSTVDGNVDSLSTESYLQALGEGQKQLQQLRNDILSRLKGN